MGFTRLKNALKEIGGSKKDEQQVLKPDNELNVQEDQNDQAPKQSNEQPLFQATQENQSTESEVPPLNVSSQKSVSTIAADIFSAPILNTEPPSNFERVGHPQQPIGCKFRSNDQPIQTNNFSNNLTLDDQTCPVWTLPYSLWLSRDPGQDVGLAFNHTDNVQKVYGPDPNSNPAQFYFNPPKIKSFVISGEGFGQNTKLELENHNKMSITGKMVMNSNQSVTIPLVQGMGFVTAIYTNVKPVLASQVGVQEFRKVGSMGNNVTKYTAKLFNQVVWSLYVVGTNELTLRDPNHIIGDKEGSTIQICRGDSQFYDESAGAYQNSVTLKGSVNADKCQYQFEYAMEGISKLGKGIVWCLPHHQEELIPDIKNTFTNLKLDSTTNGVMQAYSTNSLIMEETLPVDIGFEPWASFAKTPNYSSEVKDLIKMAASIEVNDDVFNMANLDSMYGSGKILDKYAYIAYVCKFILKDDKLTAIILPKVKSAIEMFAKNEQKLPLVYDTTWKGLRSSAEPGADFGNSNYNDHHFHYGYHIHAIALIAKIDSDWLKSNSNLVLNYSNALLRDVANPQADEFFPQFRSFDWYHGHSFAHGIFPSGDGKNEESSSEDYHFAYGMKLFASVVGDINMEHRANLMLAIMRRSMNMYMLYSDDNKIQPPNFIKNKVSGILFENKIDFTTFFGRGTIADEFIHGIHMLPITPISSFIRKEQFVKEEWEQKLGKIVDRIPDGWKGILMLNRALYDPKAAWNWFARDDWNPNLIDNGMSRTWSLAFIAGIGGAP
jgi:Predicted glycosyl hydrolase